MSWSGSNPNPACPNEGRAAEQAAGRFYDVEASDTHAAAIGCVAFYGVTLGAGDGTIYGQSRAVTRKQMAMFLSRVVERLGLRPDSQQLEEGDLKFGDIRGLSSAAHHAVQVVVAAEIMPGLSATRFAPDTPVRRDNMAMFLANLLELATTNVRNSPIMLVQEEGGGWALLRDDGTDISVSADVFTDLGNVGAAQRHAINAMWEIGVVAGKSGSRRFDPSGSVTRAQMASFIVRALGHTAVRPDGQVTLPPLPPKPESEPEGGDEDNTGDSQDPPAPERPEPETPRPSASGDGSDPLRLIAHAPFARAYSLPDGQMDRLAVWLCNTPDGDQRFSENRDERHNPHNYADKFTQQVSTYFNWLSEGIYWPAFIPGGVITVWRSWQGDYWGQCADAVLGRSHPDNTDGAIIVVDHGGGEQILGLGTCGYYSQRNFPGNQRVVLVDSQAFLDPHLLAHEIGHSLCWPHSYSRETFNRDGDYWEYDDPMDIMGTPVFGAAASAQVPQVGTSAINRYAAGWISPSQVWVHKHGTEARYKLHPIGSDGRQMLIVPFGPSNPDGGHDDYLALGVRVTAAGGWWHGDRGIPKEGVEIYWIGQSREFCNLPDRGSCHGLDRYHWPIIAADYPYSEAAPGHVMAVGDEGWSFQQEGVAVSVAARDGDAFYVDVSHYSPADHQPNPPSTYFGAWKRDAGYEGYWLEGSGSNAYTRGWVYVGCADGDPSVIVDSWAFVSSDYTDNLLRIDYKANTSLDRKWAWWLEIDTDSASYRIMPRYRQEAERFAVYLRANPGQFRLSWLNWHSEEWTSIWWDDTTGISAVMSALSCFDG